VNVIRMPLSVESAAVGRCGGRLLAGRGMRPLAGKWSVGPNPSGLNATTAVAVVPLLSVATITLSFGLSVGVTPGDESCALDLAWMMVLSWRARVCVDPSFSGDGQAVWTDGRRGAGRDVDCQWLVILVKPAATTSHHRFRSLSACATRLPRRSIPSATARCPWSQRAAG